LEISVSPMAGTFLKEQRADVNMLAVSSLLIEFLAPATCISPLSGVGPSTISVSMAYLLWAVGSFCNSVNIGRRPAKWKYKRARSHVANGMYFALDW
jgi:hypothetical protein